MVNEFIFSVLFILNELLLRRLFQKRHCDDFPLARTGVLSIPSASDAGTVCTERLTLWLLPPSPWTSMLRVRNQRYVTRTIPSKGCHR